MFVTGHLPRDEKGNTVKMVTKESIKSIMIMYLCQKSNNCCMKNIIINCILSFNDAYLGCTSIRSIYSLPTWAILLSNIMLTHVNLSILNWPAILNLYSLIWLFLQLDRRTDWPTDRQTEVSVLDLELKHSYLTAFSDT